jgi:hypothetical protein
MGLRSALGKARKKRSTAAPKKVAATKKGAPTRAQSTRSDALTRSLVVAAETAGSERLLAVDQAADRLNRFLREHRAILISISPVILAGTKKAPQLILERDGSFRVRSTSGRGKSILERVRPAELVELWVIADLYERIEAALRGAAGLATRPTGAVVAGIGVAGDRGAKV